jgi:hypothetical protein
MVPIGKEKKIDDQIEGLDIILLQLSDQLIIVFVLYRNISSQFLG